MPKHRRILNLSIISFFHYIKLCCRSLLFLTATIIYIVVRIKSNSDIFSSSTRYTPFYALIWLVFTVEMMSRFFPSKLESMGCEKQFAENYIPKEGGSIEVIKRNSWKTTLAVAASWICLNSIIGLLYYLNVIDTGILILISLAYSVCDMICILFFCPFQTWIMKNKCCGSCRIYNWDYAMMFTPLIFVKDIFAWSLLGISLALLIKWELVFHLHPERFSEATNQSLTCACCEEKLCHHKKQLRGFLIKRANVLSKDTLHHVKTLNNQSTT